MTIQHANDELQSMRRDVRSGSCLMCDLLLRL